MKIFGTETRLYCALLVCCACAILHGENRAATVAGASPVAIQGKVVVSNDSARIISPAYKSILDGDSVVYEIAAACPVSRAILYVSYYPSRTDTLARCDFPPFTAVWRTAGIPDQDQVHLQFGYVLYHVNGDIIVSAPAPHRWILCRGGEKSAARYRCREAPAGATFVVDGRGEEWRGFHRASCSSNSGFYCSWTAADFFCCIEVYDRFVVPGDRVELCFDLPRTGGGFFGGDHRIISFDPLSRSFAWAVALPDTGPVILDSVIVRIDEEVEWRCEATGYGYCVEARIPFCVLSSSDFPPKKFGFDVSILDYTDSRESYPLIHTWSGAPAASRRMPLQWGTVILRQAFLPLKVTLQASLCLLFILVIGMAGLMVYRGREESYYEKLERRGVTPRLRTILDCIEKRSTQPSLTPAGLAEETGYTVDELEGIVRAELGVSSERIIAFMRVQSAKPLLSATGKGIAEIAAICGFTGERQFVESFTALAGVSPQQWRENRLRDARDDDDEDAPKGAASGESGYVR
jgi:AraC-like DNA-binding protein